MCELCLGTAQDLSIATLAGDPGQGVTQPCPEKGEGWSLQGQHVEGTDPRHLARAGPGWALGARHSPSCVTLGWSLSCLTALLTGLQVAGGHPPGRWQGEVSWHSQGPGLAIVLVTWV